MNGMRFPSEGAQFGRNIDVVCKFLSKVIAEYSFGHSCWMSLCSVKKEIMRVIDFDFQNGCAYILEGKK